MHLMLAILLIALVAILLGIGFLLAFSPKPRKPTENEKYYRHVQSAERQPVPSLFDPPSVNLSCVIPAFDESKRLSKMLTEAVQYLQMRKSKDKSFTYELIVVDDGSRDNTAQVAVQFGEDNKNVDLRVLKLEKNRGKGGAVTQGMLCARGERCLMADADGATRFADLEKLEDALDSLVQGKQGIAVGSRSHLVTTEAVVKRSFIRNFLMRCFHTLVFVLGIHGIEDTQCGFKLFTRETAQIIFPNMHVERWIFDIECLLIAQYEGIPIREVQVNWQEVDGSKINLMTDSVLMARDLFLIRLNYILRLWTIDRNKAPKSQ